MNNTSVPQRMPTIEIVRKKQDPNYVAPVSDYLLGRRMFRDAIQLASCTSRAMRLGWQDAASAAMDAEYSAGGLASMEALAGVLQ